jgi:transposase-like protein
MAKKGQRFKKYSFELKKQVIKEYLNGVSKRELLTKYEIKNDTQIESWVRIYKKEGNKGLKSKQKGRPIKCVTQTELEQLRMENEILKKIQDLLEQEKP